MGKDKISLTGDLFESFQVSIWTNSCKIRKTSVILIDLLCSFVT